MINENTPVKMSIYCDKITDTTNLHTTTEDYKELLNVLKDISKALYIYVFIEQAAVEDIKWADTMPIMDRLMKEMNKTQIAPQFKAWHYNNANSPEYIPHLTALAKDFLVYLTRLTNSPFFL